MNLTEKAAYIKGLIEGINLDDNKEETKILKSIVDLLEDVALSIKDLDNAFEEHSEIIDELDENLADVEDIVYGCDCNDSDCGCCGCDSEIYKVSCPNCEQVIELNEGMFAKDENEILCPNCGEKLEFSFEDVSEN